MSNIEKTIAVFMNNILKNSFGSILIVYSFKMINIAILLGDEAVVPRSELIPEAPKYELLLTQREYTLLSNAVIDGVKKYGGGIEFCSGVRKYEDELKCSFSVEGVDSIEVISAWISQEIANCIKKVDVDNIDDVSISRLKILKSIGRKFDEAKQKPERKTVRFSGVVEEKEEGLYLIGENGSFEATGDYLHELKKRIGKQVIALGKVKVRNKIEVRAFLEKKENTLELFVMSMCPFSKTAEKAIINYLDNYQGKGKPVLEIHYIFYKKEKNGKEIFASLHGEGEIHENLVQMVLRDAYPEYYLNYVLERTSDSDSPWKQIAMIIGMDEKQLDSIEHIVEQERELRIRDEYNYVTGTYQIYDGSPNYVWECERVADVKTIDLFKDLRYSNSTCADKTK